MSLPLELLKQLAPDANAALFLQRETGRRRGNRRMSPLYLMVRICTTLIFISVLWHHEHLLGYLLREHMAGSHTHTLTVLQNKVVYLCTCFFPQRGSTFCVCVKLRTWAVSQVWVYATCEKKPTSAWSTYLWRSEGLVQRWHRLSGGLSETLIPHRHLFTNCLQRSEVVLSLLQLMQKHQNQQKLKKKKTISNSNNISLIWFYSVKTVFHWSSFGIHHSSVKYACVGVWSYFQSSNCVFWFLYFLYCH